MPRRHIAEGVGRVTLADKARGYAIARGECVERWRLQRSLVERVDAAASAASVVLGLGNEPYLR